MSRLIEDNFDIIPGNFYKDPEDKPANFYHFPYDWRQDNRETAKILQEQINNRTFKSSCQI